TLFPCATLFRSAPWRAVVACAQVEGEKLGSGERVGGRRVGIVQADAGARAAVAQAAAGAGEEGRRPVHGAHPGEREMVQRDARVLELVGEKAQVERR